MRRLAVAAALLLIAFGGPPTAAQPGRERLYHAEHGGWAVDCTEDAAFGTVRCLLSGGGTLRRGAEETGYLVVILGTRPGERGNLTVHPDPPGSAAGVILRIDANAPWAAACVQDCALGARPGRAIVAEMRAGKTLGIRLDDREGGADPQVAIDLAGFDAAWRDLIAAAARLRERSST